MLGARERLRDIHAIRRAWAARPGARAATRGLAARRLHRSQAQHHHPSLCGGIGSAVRCGAGCPRVIRNRPGLPRGRKPLFESAEGRRDRPAEIRAQRGSRRLGGISRAHGCDSRRPPRQARDGQAEFQRGGGRGRLPSWRRALRRGPRGNDLDLPVLPRCFFLCRCRCDLGRRRCAGRPPDAACGNGARAHRSGIAKRC